MVGGASKTAVSATHMELELRSITAADTLPIRHKVLWPDKPPEYSMVDNDAEGWHLGVFAQGQLICVASVFVDEDVARLRKFATLPEHRSKGAGTAAIVHIITTLKSRGIREFWCDARMSATGFYERFGMRPQDDTFFKGDEPYVKMAVQLATV